MPGHFIKPFFEGNLLLLISAVIFAVSERLFDGLGWQAAFGARLRVAQGLVFAALLSPLVLTALPSTPRPTWRMPSFRSVADVQPGIAGTPAAVSGRARVPAASEIIANRLVRIQRAGAMGFAWWLTAVWLLGVTALMARLAWRLRKVEHFLQGVVPLRRLGRVLVGVSAATRVPLSARRGSLRWVVLPESLVGKRSDWKIALQHELQHHRQGDTQWALFAEILVCIAYFNPAVFWWKRRINELQEFSCDEALVGQRKLSSREYGSCLVRVAEAALGCREAYVGTTYMAAAAGNPIYFKSFLIRRVEMVMNGKRSRRWAGPLLGTLGLFATLGMAYGIENSSRDVGRSLPNPGQVVVDENIQSIAHRILKDALITEDASEGFAIVADPLSGKILAVANVDMTEKKKGYWSLAERIEPASIAKSFVVAEALEKGVTTPGEEQYCDNGNYTFGGRVFHDWKGFGWLTTSQTVAMSSDIGVLKVAEKLGRDNVYELLGKYGIGPDGSAKEFPAARVGTLPPKTGPGSEFTLPFVTFGQGFRTTPLELVQAYGAIANGGQLLTPLAANASDSDRHVVRQLLSEENAAKMREILRAVVLSGTGKRRATSYLYTTAGKTATGFSPADDWLDDSRGTYAKANMAGFIGFAPVDHPRVEVFVGIRDPKSSVSGQDSGAHGAEHAAPVFKNIAEAVLQYMRVPPDLLPE